jgi:hypothetical protein
VSRTKYLNQEKHFSFKDVSPLKIKTNSLKKYFILYLTVLKRERKQK